MKASSVCAALAALLVFSACQEPAGVGLGLIGEEGANPNVLPIPASSADTVRLQTPAIGFAEQGTRAQTRVLIGNVVDPAFGDARALGYLDAVQPTIASGLEADDVRAVWVELRREYAYGDTTTALPLTLSQVLTPGSGGAWEADASYPPDTTFATGPVLATATATTAAADSLVRFDLPEAWVRQNAALLLAEEAEFLSNFEGFAFDVADTFVPAPGVVYGFSTLQGEGSGIRVAAADDTLFFPFAEVFSSIAQDPPVAAPAPVLPARSLTAAAVLRFDFSGIGPLPLAQAALRTPIEESLARDGAFVRPLARRMQIVGVRNDTTRVLIGELERTTTGELRPSALSAGVLTERIQEALVEGAATSAPFYDRFEIVFPTGLPASLDIFPLLRPDAAPAASPRFTLLVIGGPEA